MKSSKLCNNVSKGNRRNMCNLAINLTNVHGESLATKVNIASMVVWFSGNYTNHINIGRLVNKGNCGYV